MTLRSETAPTPEAGWDESLTKVIRRVNSTPVILCDRCGFWRDGRYVFPEALWAILRIPASCDEEIAKRVLLS